MNGEDFILDQLNSIKNQTYKDFDLFIKDNFEDSKPFTFIANTFFGDNRNQN